MAEGGADAGLELGHAEGLGHVVVGPAVQRRHLAVLGAAGRQDDDGDLAPLADPLGHGQSVEVGQPEVEDDDVRGDQGGLGDPLLAVGRGETSWPPACSPTRRARSSDGSSSMTRTWAMARYARSSGAAIGQGQDETGSAAGPVLDPDVLAVGLDEGLGDGQAEAGPPSGVEADVPVEHLLALVGRHPRPRIGDREADPVAPGLGGHRDRALAGGVPVGVVQQVGQHLTDQQWVDVDQGQVAGDRAVDRTAPERRPEAGHRGVHQLPDGRRAPPDLEHAGIDAGHVEQAGDQAGEPIGLDVDQSVQLVGVGP